VSRPRARPASTRAPIAGSHAPRVATLGVMRRATLDELAGDPVGRWVGGETFVHFCAAPTL